MRICYLANGQSIHTKKWVTYFSDNGYDVHLVTFTKTEHIEGVKVHNLRYFLKWAYPLRIIEVRRTVKRIGPDVLHAHYVSHYGMYGALTGLKPFVVSAWGSDVLTEPEKSRIRKHTVKYVLSKADVITCDAQHMREAMKRLGAVPEKILNRPKQPYRAPDAASFLGTDAPEYCGEAFSQSSLRRVGLFNASAVSGLVSKCASRLQPRSHTALLSNTDNMAIVGILSTQLLHAEMVEGTSRNDGEVIRYEMDADHLVLTNTMGGNK